LRLTPEAAAPPGVGASGGGGDGDRRHAAPEWRTGDVGTQLRLRGISLSDLILLPISPRFLL
jgi:hypothetical protein